MATPALAPAASMEFARALEALTDSRMFGNTRVEVLPNGEHFYEAELAAIRNAHTCVNLEAYIFERGDVTRRFLEALTERARNGVKVNLVVDAVGSAGTFKTDVKRLRDAGGKFAWYHPLWWNTWLQFNNRTHRELLVVDGRTAFLGGAGIADHWLKSQKDQPRWRDTMFRVEGDAVTGLQSTFLENWLESTGDVLAGEEYFPFREERGPTQA